MAVFIRWFLLYTCFLAAPVLARIVILNNHEQGWLRSDIAGFASDAALALITAFLYNALALKSRWAGAPVILVWCLFHTSNFEHVSANGDLVSFAYIGYLFDPTFFLGSAIVVSNKLLTASMVLLSFSVLWVRPVRLSILSCVLACAVVTALLAVRPAFSTFMDPRWRRYNVIQANAKDLFYSITRKPAPAMTRETRMHCGSLLRKDLSGAPFVPPGNKRDNVLLVILEGCCGGMLPSLSAYQGVRSDIAMRGLDSIARRHILYANFITHQRQTNRGEFSILSGTYPKLNSSTPKMTEYVAVSRNSCSDGKKFLPGLLASHGFETTYLQAAPLPYMLKDAFMKRAGFQRIHGTEWFKYHYALGYWGVDDKSFFEQAFTLIQSKKKLKKPWFITLLTVGTHHPVTIPGNYGDPGNESVRARGFRYLDEAVCGFLGSLSSKGILDNTLVIITCDESQGIAGKNDLPVVERICQQWGLCIILHPRSAEGMRIDERYASSDIALSVLDYLRLPTDTAPFGGRSIFRKYGRERDIYFANTYGGFTGRFTNDDFIDLCSGNLRYGERYSVEGNRLFSFNKKFIGAVDAGNRRDIGQFASVCNASVIDPSAAGDTYDFHTGITHAIGKGPQQNLVAGQFFVIPKGCFVSVRFRGRVLPGDSCAVFLKHDLASNSGRMRIVEYLHGEAAQGDTFSAQYGFYCNESYYFSEFRATAEVVKGNAARVVLDEAALSYTRRPPTAEERKKYFRPFDRNVGRDPGVSLTVRRRT
ncbi:MAG: LTA synthase family protein [Chitinispirillaceae bacterium]|nr:LTA synthase family protein [Chitinispirillaceae bacterium]